MAAYTKRINKNRGYMRLEVWQKSMEIFQLVTAMYYSPKTLLSTRDITK
jgi:hypothetical protein